MEVTIEEVNAAIEEVVELLGRRAGELADRLEASNATLKALEDLMLDDEDE